MECVLCGRDFKELKRIKLEGSLIEVCDRCAESFGRLVEKPGYKMIKKKVRLGGIKSLKEDKFELVPNYGSYVKKSRQAKGLKRANFAEMINEKDSVIRRVEKGQLRPDDKLIKKIEDALGIKLIQKYREEEVE